MKTLSHRKPSHSLEKVTHLAGNDNKMTSVSNQIEIKRSNLIYGFNFVIISPTPNINDGNTSIVSSAAAAAAPPSASQNEANEKL